MSKVTNNHCVMGVGLVPGAYSVSKVLDKFADRTSPGNSLVLTDVSFLEPILDEAKANELVIITKPSGIEQVSLTDGDKVYLTCKLGNACGAAKGLRASLHDHGWEGTDSHYRSLDQYGNRFAGHFQSIRKVSLIDSTMCFLLDTEEVGVVSRPAMMLDGCFHSALVYLCTKLKERYQPMVLSGIEELSLFSRLGAIAKCILVERTCSEDHISADISAFSQEGDPVVTALGVRFSRVARFFDSPKLVSFFGNFTLEPIERSFSKLSEKLNIRARAIYHSYTNWEYCFSRPNHNADVNVLVLQPEELCGLPLQERSSKYGSRFLPNGIEVNELNDYETDYVYKEIFVDQCYLRHGVVIHNNDTVIDVGANIGLFALFAQRQASNVQTFSFEPSPIVADILRTNLAGRGMAQVIEKGVSATSSRATFTFYPRSSVFSGFYTGSDDESNITAIVAKILGRLGIENDEYRDELTNSFTQQRFEKSQYECQLVRLSDFLREKSINEIGLLKIDAERSELDVLAGIEDSDFAKIRQIVMEVHETKAGELHQVTTLLEKQGFMIYVDKEEDLSDSSLYTLTAINNRRIAIENVNLSTPQKLNNDLYNRFIAKITRYNELSNPPMCLVLAPSRSEGQFDFADWMRHKLEADIADLEKVSFLNSHEFYQAYSRMPTLAPHRASEALVPYSDEWYVAVGYSAIRHLLSVNKSPLKVIVLDADNTLWRGVCGEAGTAGVEIDEPYQRWQRFLLKKKEQGVLLCIASKNKDHDVLQVLDGNDHCLIKNHDLALSAINWKRKSDNIHNIAKHLDLSFDSIVFVDDNPIECADVKLNCPGTCVIQFSENGVSDNTFFQSNWALDCFWSTEDDRLRTQRYQESYRRNELLKEADSFIDFLQNLHLKIDVSFAEGNALVRVAQLFMRTSQFNANKKVFSEKELQLLQDKTEYSVLQIKVSDKFGDYGLVGAAVVSRTDEMLVVENIVLSCRVLGRGVEFEFAKRIATFAESHSLKKLRVNWLATDRNAPFLNFARVAVPSFVESEQGSAVFDVSRWSELNCLDCLEKDLVRDTSADVGAGGNLSRRAKANGGLVSLISINNFGCELDHADFMRDLTGQVSGDFEVEFEIPTGLDEVERRVFEIFNRSSVEIRFMPDDDLFASGGTSLMLVNILGNIYREFRIQIDLSDGYANCSIEKMAQLVRKKSGDSRVGDVPRRAPLELQKGIFFSSLLNPNTHDFNVPLQIRFSAQPAFDSSVLRGALEKVLVDHKLLRATFRQKGRDTIVTISQDSDICVEEFDLSQASEEELQQCLIKSAHRPFVLSKGPLVRCHLFNLGDGDYALLLVFHHIVVDLLSLETIYQELSFNLRRHSGVFERRTHREEFALGGTFSVDDMKYWCNTLAGLEELNIPVRGASYKRSFEGDGYTVQLQNEIFAAIVHKASQYGVSRNVFLLAAYSDFIFSHYGNRRIAIGVPVSLRGNDIQVCNNTNLIPIQVNYQKEGFSALVDQVSRRFKDALDHRHIPYSEIVRNVVSRKNPSRSPLVQTTILVQELEGVPELAYALSDGLVSPRLDFGGMPAQIVGVIQQCAQVDLSLEFLVLAGSLALNVKFDSHVLTAEFSKAYVDEFLEHLSLLVL